MIKLNHSSEFYEKWEWMCENGFVESDDLHEYFNRFTEEDLEKLYDYYYGLYLKYCD